MLILYEIYKNYILNRIKKYYNIVVGDDMIYFISDTHFNHSNIIKYCNRPFKDINEMNDTLISNWNSIIKNDDIVYHLGDFGLLSFEEFKSILNRLNGQIYLLRGNHDGKSIKYYEELGIKVIKNMYILNDYKVILSHRPLPDSLILKGYINIHGHIHNKKLSDEYDSRLYSDIIHYNASVNNINFFPITIKEIK